MFSSWNSVLDKIVKYVKRMDKIVKCMDKIVSNYFGNCKRLCEIIFCLFHQTYYDCDLSIHY